MFNSFPREIAFPNRRLVFNLQEYIKFINLYNGKRELHTTVYSYRGVDGKVPLYDEANITHAFFDFDSDESYEPVKRFVEYLQQDEIQFAVNLSGGGFHVYIGVNQKEVLDVKLSLKTFQEEVLNNYDLLEFADPHGMGDVARLTRIPNTFNLRRGRYCIPLKPEEMELPLEDIKEIAKRQRPFNFWVNKGKKLDLPIVESDLSITYKGIDNIDIYAVEPCIDNIRKDSNPSHDARFFLVLYLSEEFRKGKNINEVNLEELSEKIIEYMRNLNWNDFCDDPNKNKSTRYQVYNIINKKLNFVPNCEWRKLKGICPGKCLISMLP